MRLLYLSIAIVLGLLFLSAPAFATGSPFSVSGQVLDRYGDPVQGAHVTLIDNSFKVIGEKLTNDAGVYDFLNVVSDSGTVTLRVNFTKDGISYTVPAYYTRWYPANGIQLIPTNETQFPDYPMPVYGYIYGAIQTDTSLSGQFINGVVYLTGTDDNVTYYLFADRTDGKASFEFYVPPGNYTLYAQHRENGVVYESAHKLVTVSGNSDISQASATSIILPLNNPTTDPDPQDLPEHQSNNVSGTVLTADGKPLPGLTVELLQQTDN